MLLDLFRNRGLDFIVEDNNRVFPETEKSQDILAILKYYLKDITIKYNYEVSDIKKEDNSLQTEADVKYNGTHYTVLGKLNIKKINFYQPILKEKTSYAYNVSVVKIKGPDLNEEGNFVIGGHNYMRKVFFMKINKLTKGDVINITDLNGRSINYYVYEYKVTSADDSSYLKDIEDGGKYITLVTCNYGGKERYIVKAKAK